MINEKNTLENFANLIDKISMYYNKEIVLDSVTKRSFGILDDSVHNLQNKFGDILTLFEEIQNESNTSAINTHKVDTMLATVLENGEKIQKEIHQRVEEIDETALNAKNTAAAFEILKDRTLEVENMLAGIQDVSVKTGILAINASIEAARAGKVGNGFRIIANEVRSLSNQTNGFTKTIEAKLAELKDSVNEINKNMIVFIELFSKFQKSFTEVLNNFDKNSMMLNNAGQSLAAITSSIKDQDVTINEGFSSLKRIEDFLKETGAILHVVQNIHTHLDTLFRNN
ncbi:MAG: methyl-accepting chemotaxis protein [Treponema sp.]